MSELKFNDMAKKTELKLTQPQLNALFELIEDSEAGIGCSDNDVETNKRLSLIYRMLKFNGYEISNLITFKI